MTPREVREHIVRAWVIGCVIGIPIGVWLERSFG